MNQRLKQSVVVLILCWVVISPFIWWNSTFSQLGGQVPLGFIVHPVLLAVTTACTAPFMLRHSRKAAIALGTTSILVIVSLFFSTSAFSDGVILNAVLLVTVAVLTFCSTGPARKAAQSG
jgi:hypothetical protein